MALGHSDIGGGYENDPQGLWRTPFTWTIEAARAAGLSLDENKVSAVLGGAQKPFRPWKQPHGLLRGWWNLAEYLPKRTWDYQSGQYVRRCNHFRPRFIPNGSRVDQSALLAIRESDYLPRNLSPEFVIAVRELSTEVPDELPFPGLGSNAERASEAL